MVVTFDTDGNEAYILELKDNDGYSVGSDWWAFNRQWDSNVISVEDWHSGKRVTRRTTRGTFRKLSRKK